MKTISRGGDQTPVLLKSPQVILRYSQLRTTGQGQREMKKERGQEWRGGKEGNQRAEEGRVARKGGTPGQHLPLGEVQVHGDLVSPEPGQVVMMSKLGLQLPQLLLGEGRPLLAGLAAALQLPSALLVVWGERAPHRTM